MGKITEMHICLGSSCFSRGNNEVVGFIKNYLQRNHYEDKVIFKGGRCMGCCNNGPNLTINGKLFENVTISKIEEILDSEIGKL